MKNISLILLIVLAAKIIQGQPCKGHQVILVEDGKCNYNPWVLVFEDNFDNDTMDKSKWIPHYTWGHTNNGIEYNQENNLKFENGILKIVAKNEPGYYLMWKYDTNGNLYTDYEYFNYTSGAITTKAKFSHGMYEIRCKIPSGNGFLPAFWMLGGKDVYSEIDVFEFWGKQPNKHLMNVHQPTQADDCGTHYNEPDYSKEFHTFTLIWNKHKMEWHVDGDLKRRETLFYTILGQPIDCNSLTAWTTYILNDGFPKDPLSIIANLAVFDNDYNKNGECDGGDNCIDETTTFPSNLEIDYIRYYQQLPCEDNVEISDQSYIDLGGEDYNIIVGKEIHFTDTFIVASGQQLKIVARDSVVIDGNFIAEEGSFLEIVIDPTSCSGSGKTNSYNTTSDFDSQHTDNLPDSLTYKPIITQISSIGEQVNIYPNPTQNIITIKIPNAIKQNFSFYVINQLGEIIFSKNKINQDFFDINFNSYSKGVYFLKIVELKESKVYLHKIVYE